MKSQTQAIPIDRYFASDIHKHYVLLGGMNAHREWVLRTRKILMSRFPEWVLKNLRPTDAVVIESTSNAWEIYDLIAPTVAKTVVANPLKVGQTSGAKVKTDRLDVERLLTLADLANRRHRPRSLGATPACARLAVFDLSSRASSQANCHDQEPSARRPPPYRGKFHPPLQSHPPEGQLFSDENHFWWPDQDFSPSVRIQIEQDLLILEHLSAHKEAIHQELACLRNRQPWSREMVFLMQIPGMGVVLSMTVLATIGDISRFEHPKNLVGYAGLGSGVHDSGQKHQGKGIPRGAHRHQSWP